MTHGSSAGNASVREQQLKSRLARAHRIIAAGGLLPLTKGHAAVRASDTGRILVLGHIHAQGRTIDTTTANDIVTISAEGADLEGAVRSVGERHIHTAVLAGRADMNASVHCHPTYATALGIAGVSILPLGNRGGLFAPKVPILDFDGQIESPETGVLVREALGEAHAVVLKNHGIVAVGTTIENAVVTAFALEETARLQWLASTVGRPEPLSQAEIDRVGPRGPDHEEFFSHVWAHYASLDPLLHLQ